MKFLKASKGLIKAVACLIVSIVLCIGVCLAWFAINTKTDSSGMGTQVNSTNIKTLSVTAYTLKADADTEGKYTVGGEAEIDEADDAVKMNEYGGLAPADGNATALLLEFKFVFKLNLSKNYAIYARCANTQGEVGGEEVNGELRLNCALSSVVSFYGIDETATSKPSTVTQNTEIAGVAVPDTKGSLVKLADKLSDANADGTTEFKFYCIIDYVENKIYSQYYKALDIEGSTFNTPMDFVNDIDFYMEESF